MYDIVFKGLTADSKARIVAAYCGTFGYQAKIRDAQGVEIDNPQTPTDFTLEKIKEGIYAITKRWQEEEKVADYRAKIRPLIEAAADASMSAIDAQAVEVYEVDSLVSTLAPPQSGGK